MPGQYDDPETGDAYAYGGKSKVTVNGEELAPGTPEYAAATRDLHAASRRAADAISRVLGGDGPFGRDGVFGSRGIFGHANDDSEPQVTADDDLTTLRASTDEGGERVTIEYHAAGGDGAPEQRVKAGRTIRATPGSMTITRRG